jgi:hypothetical protein
MLWSNLRENFAKQGGAQANVEAASAGCFVPSRSLCSGFLVFIAVAGLQTAPSYAADDVEIDRSVRATVPPGKETFVPFRTFPNAVCTFPVRFRGGKVTEHNVYADDVGIVRLYVRPLPLGKGEQQLEQRFLETATCTAEGKTARTTIELRASSTPTPDMPAPRRDFADRALQQLGTPRKPLVGDPSAIPQEQLRSMGYPPRPDPVTQPSAYALWLRLAKMPLRFIPPKEVPLEERFGDINSSIWAGYGVTGAPFSIHLVTGSWHLPSVWSPVAPIYSWNGGAALWVGIGGRGIGTDLAQCGTDSHSYNACEDPTNGCWSYSYYFTWHEWYPNLPMGISNFPVSPGDEVAAQVSAAGSPNANPTYFVANVTAGVFSLTTDSQPANSNFLGEAAEWILERPIFSNGQILSLAPFSSDAMIWNANVEGVAFGNSNLHLTASL